MEADMEHTLIGSDRVGGTEVYNPDGEHLGEIREIMIDRLSGNVAYAVMSFGGFLGVGEKYHPLPWSALKYDKDIGGYVVNVSRDQLRGGPAYDASKEPGWGDRDYETKLHDYYGLPPYWLV
jgi:hypothetical protein